MMPELKPVPTLADLPCEIEDPDARLRGIQQAISARLNSGMRIERIAVEAELRVDDVERFLAVEEAEGLRFLEGRYDSVYDNLTAWLQEAEDTGPAVGLASLIETEAVKVLVPALDHTREHQQFRAAVGRSGIGKSHIARAYAASHAKTPHSPGAVYVCFSKTHNSPVAVLGAIAEQVPGCRGAAHHKAALLSMLHRSLGPGDMFILDEANYPAAEGETADVFRDLWRDGQGPGIVLLGNPTFTKSVWGREDVYLALGSRLVRLDVPDTGEADVDAVLLALGLHGRALRAAALHIVTRPAPRGSLRALFMVLDGLAARAPGATVTADTLRLAAQALGRW